MPVYVSDYTAIISGDSWSGELGTPTVVTYSFETEVQPEVAGLYNQAFADSFGPMGAGIRALARQAFGIWADACGLVFVEVPAGEGDIRLGMFNFTLASSVSGFTGFAYHPQRVVYDYGLYEWPVGGDVFFNSTRTGNIDLDLIMHEIGHALGLSHPFEGDIQLQPAYDNGTYTVMSYNRGNVMTLGTFDVDAMHYYYGPPSLVPSATGGIQSFAVDQAAMSTVQGWGDAASNIFGSSLDDEIAAGGGNDTVGGFRGDDLIDGGAGDDTLLGGDGGDTLIGGPGNDRLIGGAYWSDPGVGNFVSFAGDTAGVAVDLGLYESTDYIQGGASGAQSGNDTLYAIDNAIGGDGNDTIEGSREANIIRGGGGDDSLAGRGADDVLVGGAGADMLDGGTGDDLMQGGGGNDTLAGGTGIDTLEGGAGHDTYLVIDGTELLVELAGGGTDLVRSSIGFTLGGEFENLTLEGSGDIDGTGNGLGNRITGNDGANLLRGEAGFDTLSGGAGDDTLQGGSGRDRLLGDAGQDRLEGGVQQDTLLGLDGDDTLLGEDGDDVLRGGSDQDLGQGGAGDDVVIGGTGRDTLYGDEGNDIVRGNGGFDTVDGGDGDDLVAGGTQADLVLGGAGNDTLQAGGGFDRLDGGTGDDELTGNFNADTFLFADGHGNDTITDFEATNNAEKIDLSGVSAISSLADLDLASATAGAATQVGADVVIDTGDGGSITLAGVALSDLDAADFIF